MKKSRLKRDADKAQAFIRQQGGKLQRDAGLKRKPPKPGKAVKRRPPPPPSALERRLQDRWAKHARSRPCANCGYDGPHVEGHHIVPKTVLKAEGLDVRAVWDLRNQLPLCSEPAPRRCHDRFEPSRTGGSRPLKHAVLIPWSVLMGKAPKVLQFAREHGLEARLRAMYPEAPAGRERVD